MIEGVLAKYPGLVLSFGLFLMNRSAGSATEKRRLEEREYDSTIRDYLEWLRKKDHEELAQEIRSSSSKIKIELAQQGLDLTNLIERAHGEIQGKLGFTTDILERLDASINVAVFSPIPTNSRNLDVARMAARDSELEWLRNIQSDALVCGQPGVGKTFLLYQLCLECDAKFVVSEDDDRIVATLNISHPATIVIDDAGRRESLIQRIIHFRQESQDDFRIIAICWPRESDAIRDVLNIADDSVLKIGPLGADVIAELISERIRKAGYEVPTDIVREIRIQASGRPGLAIQLTELALANGFKVLFDGRVHFELLRRTLPESEVDETGHLLSCFAVGGKAGMPFSTVAKHTGKSSIDIRVALEGLATGGVIEQTGDREFAVIPPAFRNALLNNKLLAANFGDERLYWLLYNDAPNRLSAFKTLCRTLELGATVDVELVKKSLGSLGSAGAWSHFARVSSEQCEFALNSRSDLIESLAEIGLHYHPDLTLLMLLRSAIGDDRPSHSNPGAPIRRIEEWLKHFSIENDDAFYRREKLITVVDAWLESGGCNSVAWRVLPLTTSLQYQSSESDPGIGRTFSITSGMVSFATLQQISPLWRRLISLIERHPPSDWAPLLGALSKWLHPYASGVEVSTEKRNFAKARSREVIDLILQIPGVPKNGIGLWIMNHDDPAIRASEIDTDFLVFSPPDIFRRNVDYETELAKCITSAEELGGTWAAREPSEIAKRLKDFSRERECVGTSSNSFGASMCKAIATASGDLSEWIDAFVEWEVDPFFVIPFVSATVELDAESAARACSKLLAIPKYVPDVVQVAIAYSQLAEPLFEEISPHLSEHTGRLYIECFRDRIEPTWLERLIGHEDASVVRAIAIGDVTSDSKYLYQKDRSRWIRAFRFGIEGLDSLDDMQFLHIDKILSSYPEAAMDLARQLIPNLESGRAVDRKRYEEIFRCLSESDRITLLPLLAETYSTDMSRLLVGENIEVYRALLEDETLKLHHMAPLTTKRLTDSWKSKAKLAVERGASPQSVVLATMDFGVVWGHGVEVWTEWLDSFSDLSVDSDPYLRRVGQEGMAQCQYLLKRAECESRHEELHGFHEDE